MEQLLRHLAEGETRLAIQDAVGLEQRLRREGKNGFPRTKAREGFLDLLKRRGYFIDTPLELKASLQEIRNVGEGFDLYDLAAQLERVKPGLLPIPVKEKRHGRLA
jgi:hypothetical protein